MSEAKLVRCMSSRLKQGFVDRCQAVVDVDCQEVHKPPESWICGSAQTVLERSILHERSPNVVDFALLNWSFTVRTMRFLIFGLRLVSECTQAYRECEKASSCLGNDVEDGWKIVHSGIE